MNQRVSLCMVLVLGSVAISGANGQAGKPDASLATLRSIRNNAEQASKNAAIYQWVRVNREVDRIAAGERAVSKAFGSHSALSAFQSAVRALRTARTTRNVSEIQQASRQVVEASDALAK